jgi:hypothetical protein
LDATNSIETETIIDIQFETFEETNSPEIVLWKSKNETLIQAENCIKILN